MKHAPRPNEYRDSWCGQLTAERAGTQARVAGWVHRRRDHGGLIFIDLRDRSGIVQLVFHPEHLSDEAYHTAHRLRSEDVVTASGTVARRDPENVNPSLATGEVELSVNSATLLADADTPPFPLDEDVAVDESLRLKYRALDLRRPSMQSQLALRHRVISTMREVLERTRLPRDRDPVPDPLHARGGTRLSRSRARAAGLVLRAAAVAAAVQATADDRWTRALLPDRSLLPRRGHARGPSARVHAARPGDVVRRRGRRDRMHGGGDARRVRARGVSKSHRRRGRG